MGTSGVTETNMMISTMSLLCSLHRDEITMHNLQYIRNLRVQIKHILVNDMATCLIVIQTNLPTAVPQILLQCTTEISHLLIKEMRDVLSRQIWAGLRDLTLQLNVRRFPRWTTIRRVRTTTREWVHTGVHHLSLQSTRVVDLQWTKSLTDVSP